MTTSDSTPPRAIGSEIRIENLVKSFGAAKALDGVSLQISAGEFVSLLGPSGSGKSTVLMSIAGFLAPDSGRILMGGLDLTPVPAHRRNIGMVFQKYSLFPHMTVARNVAFPLRMRSWGRDRQAEAVRLALDRVQLGHLAERYPAQLSGGQQQRVALARALVFDPPLLLMDEPLGALDKKLREELQLEIKLLQQRLGITVLFVTHDQQEALAMSDRIAVMDDGRIEQIGAPALLYSQPETAFVAGFVGDSNWFTGRVLANAAPGQLVDIDLGFGRFAATAAPRCNLRQGDKCRVIVRPEQLHIGVADTANRFEATVMSVMFAGAQTNITVDVAGKRLVLNAVGPQHESYAGAIGQRIAVGCDAADCLAFADPDAGAQTDRGLA